MKTITVNFKNLVSELKQKEMKLCFLNNGKLFLEDGQNNLFQMETSKQGSYLDKLIKEGNSINFHKVEKSLSANVENWRKNILGALEVQDFINTHSRYW